MNMINELKEKKMIAIVAADNNWGIGCKGNLLKRIPEDMKRFKELTTNNVIIIGRKTLESFPNGKPLPNRINIVLTRNEDYKVENAIVVHNLEQLNDMLFNLKLKDEKIFVCGGGEIYRQLLPFCEEVYVTRIDDTYNNADTFFPTIDVYPDWRLVSVDGIPNEHYFSFETYTRNFFLALR